MQVIIIDKIPLLKMLRGFFTLEFGIVDYDNFLDCLCSGINGGFKNDRRHVHDMVYGDAWLQGHHDPYEPEQMSRIQAFAWDIRAYIVREIHWKASVPETQNFQCLIRFTSNMSLKFEII